MNADDHSICISTMNCRPRRSRQRTSTMLFFFRGVSGTSSGVRYSISSISSSADSNGSKAFKRLIIRSGCSPNTFLKVKSAFGFRYLMACSFNVNYRIDSCKYNEKKRETENLSHKKGLNPCIRKSPGPRCSARAGAALPIVRTSLTPCHFTLLHITSLQSASWRCPSCFPSSAG